MTIFPKHLRRTVGCALMTGVLQLFPFEATAAPPADTSTTWLRTLALGVSDMDRSVDFYSHLLGMKVALLRTDKGVSTAVLSPSGKLWDPECLVVLTRDAAHTAPLVMGDVFKEIAFSVPDVDAALRRISDAGYKVTQQPIQDTRLPRYYAYVEDPNGYRVEILTIRAAAPAP